MKIFRQDRKGSKFQETFVSLTNPIVRQVKSFLFKEGMRCKFTQDGLVQLIDILSVYREEGKFLFPNIYVVDDVKMLARVLSPSMFHKIGEGDKKAETMLEAVKKSAPLTEEQWMIYILRRPNTFEYGIFRSGTNILSVPISEIIMSKDAPIQPAILVRHIGERTVELKGTRANSITITFSTQDKIQISPTALHNRCVECILANAKEELKDQARTFFRRLFLEVHHKGNGTLAAIINHELDDFPDILHDGIKLDVKIDVIEAIKNFNTQSSLEASNNIEGYFSLLKGMLASDGVTIFANDGSVRGYNVFIKHSGSASIREKFGGSRKRTFNSLKETLNDNLIAAYMQSKDGNIQFEHK